MNAIAACERLRARPIIAAVRAPTADAALRAAAAAFAGGVRAFEVPLTAPGAFRVISDLRREHGDAILLGAGAVVSPDAADRAVKAGVQFVASPHTSYPVLDFCRSRGLLAIPGAATPTEVMAAWSTGAPLVKVFPAAVFGGAAYVRALRESLGDVRLVPEGGIGPDTIVAHFRAGASAVTIGGGLFMPGDLATANWGAIAERARAMVLACEELA